MCKLALSAYFVFLTALEHLVVDLEACAQFVFLVRQLESFPALRTHADVVSTYAQEHGGSARAARAAFAVEPPPAHEAEEGHVVGQLALGRLQDFRHTFLLFEEVECPVIGSRFIECGRVCNFNFVSKQWVQCVRCRCCISCGRIIARCLILFCLGELSD